MHCTVFTHFDGLCRRLGAGGTVLELGAMAGPHTLLALPSLKSATRRIGINMDPQAAQPGIEMLVGNCNHMPMIESCSIDLVLCNSMLEHDRAFWLTLAEMRRVLKPGGLFMVGVPGFAERRPRPLLRALGLLWKRPLPGAAALESSLASTPSLVVHRYPADYFRFGRDAMREVLLDGLDMVSVEAIMQPPRFIGVGRKPQSTG